MELSDPKDGLSVPADATGFGDSDVEAERTTGRHPHEGVASSLTEVSRLPRGVARTRSQFNLVAGVAGALLDADCALEAFAVR